MVLPDLRLPSRANQHWQFSGIDHPDHCLDKKHFESYPYEVSYDYNSRGFRDSEWPSSLDELQNRIWCVGDSFTVGVGSPLSHTWPTILSRITKQPIVNVSLDGASNNWIARICDKIINEIKPTKLVAMWSYTERRELPDTSLTDEYRRTQNVTASDKQNWHNFMNCLMCVKLAMPHSVHFCIPQFHSQIIDLERSWQNCRGTDWPSEAPDSIDQLLSLPQWIIDELTIVHQLFNAIETSLNLENKLKQLQVVEVRRKDFARDGHHFDLVTAHWVAQQAAALL